MAHFFEGEALSEIFDEGITNSCAGSSEDEEVVPSKIGGLFHRF